MGWRNDDVIDGYNSEEAYSKLNIVCRNELTVA